MAYERKLQYTANTDETSNAYVNAMNSISDKLATTPTYDSKYDAQIEDVYNKIVNRAPFTYNARDDQMFQDYLSRYQQAGKIAMKDTIGQAAALTGGYGNTYAQRVGQQTYDQYLTEANAMLPQFYSMALERYNAEGDRLNDQYAMIGDLRDSAYGKYRDAMSDYNYNLGLAGDWENRQYQRGVDEDNTLYAREQDAFKNQQALYDNLYNVILNTGYYPSDSELQSAGMSRELANALASEYSRQVAIQDQEMALKQASASRSGGSSGGGRSSSSSYYDDDYYDYGDYDIDFAYEFVPVVQSNNFSQKEIFDWIDQSNADEKKKQALKTDYGAMQNSAWRNR